MQPERKIASKNLGNHLAFNKLFFEKHQDKLLYLLNDKKTRKWFRWVLRINGERSSVGNCTITKIEPHAIHWANKSEFRPHAKFGKRIYHAFKPLWWTLHTWDWLVADRVVPQLSFGFDTLTAYPVAGAVSPVDGQVARITVRETFSTIRTGAGNFVDVTSANNPHPRLRAENTTNDYEALRRTIRCFDTSSIGANDISAATYSEWGYSKTNGLGSPDWHLAGATPATTDNLVNGDYGQCGTTSFGSVTYANFDGTNSAYTDLTVNASGLTNINKTGISSFSTQLSWDVLNDTTGLTWASFATSYFEVADADTAGTANDPKLVVTHAAATTTSTSSSVSTSSSISTSSTSTSVSTSTSISTSSTSSSVSTSISTSSTSSSISTSSTSSSISTSSTSSSTSLSTSSTSSSISTSTSISTSSTSSSISTSSTSSSTSISTSSTSSSISTSSTSSSISTSSTSSSISTSSTSTSISTSSTSSSTSISTSSTSSSISTSSTSSSVSTSTSSTSTSISTSSTSTSVSTSSSISTSSTSSSTSTSTSISTSSTSSSISTSSTSSSISTSSTSSSISTSISTSSTSQSTSFSTSSTSGSTSLSTSSTSSSTSTTVSTSTSSTSTSLSTSSSTSTTLIDYNVIPRATIYWRLR